MDVCDKPNRYDVTLCARAIVGDQAILDRCARDLLLPAKTCGRVV